MISNQIQIVLIIISGCCYQNYTQANQIKIPVANSYTTVQIADGLYFIIKQLLASEACRRVDSWKVDGCSREGHSSQFFSPFTVEISSGTSKCSVLPVHRSFMAGMQMKANESAWLMYILLFLFCIINELVFVYGLMQMNTKN